MNYPNRDQWEAHLANCGELTIETAKKDLSELNVGSLIVGTYNAGQGIIRPIVGIVTKIAKKNITYIYPYGGFAGDDFLCLQEGKTSKDNIQHFFPKIKLENNGL